MNDIPSFFHIKPPGTSLNNRFNHSGNTDVQNPEVNSDNYNRTENDQCIVGQFFTTWPANLLSSLQLSVKKENIDLKLRFMPTTPPQTIWFRDEEFASYNTCKISSSPCGRGDFACFW